MGGMNVDVPKTQKAMVLEKRGGQIVYKTDYPVAQPGPDEVLVNIKVRILQCVLGRIR
jgi:hypothetical protein